METHIVINTWTNKIVYKGSYDQCVKYIQGNNTYQMNYSKLVLKPNMGLVA